MEKAGNEKDKIELTHRIALIHCKKREYDDALKLLNSVREQTEKMYGSIHLKVGKLLIDLGNISRKKKEYDSAEKYLFRASEILIELKCPRDHPYFKENHISLNKLKKKSFKCTSCAESRASSNSGVSTKSRNRFKTRKSSNKLTGSDIIITQ